jgi:hypothetical protein
MKGKIWLGPDFFQWNQKSCREYFGPRNGVAMEKNGCHK